MSAIQRVDPVGYTVGVIDRLKEAWTEVDELKVVITDANTRLEAAKEKASKAFRELHEELTRMDVATPGNYGWEQRVARFLVGVRTAA